MLVGVCIDINVCRYISMCAYIVCMHVYYIYKSMHVYYVERICVRGVYQYVCIIIFVEFMCPIAWCSDADSFVRSEWVTGDPDPIQIHNNYGPDIQAI